MASLSARVNERHTPNGGVFRPGAGAFVGQSGFASMAANRLRLVRPADEAELPQEIPPFPVVYQQYCRYVARIASRLLGHEDEVRDVVQDVFLAAMQNLDSVESARSLKGWLASITVNKVVSRLRWRKVRSLLTFETHGAMVAPSAPTSPEQAAAVRRVYRELDRLPVKHRIAWLLRYVEEEPLDEVARICGCSLATAKRWIAAAQGTLRDLEPREPSAPDSAESEEEGGHA